MKLSSFSLSIRLRAALAQELAASMKAARLKTIAGHLKAKTQEE